MPRFFVHSRRGGEIALDMEGQDLPSLESAKAAAIASVRELLADEIKHPKVQPLEAVIVAYENGKRTRNNPRQGYYAGAVEVRPSQLAVLFQLSMRSHVACWHV
jgi:hypothetical protein